MLSVLVLLLILAHAAHAENVTEVQEQCLWSSVNASNTNTATLRFVGCHLGYVLGINITGGGDDRVPSQNETVACAFRCKYQRDQSNGGDGGDSGAVGEAMSLQFAWFGGRCYCIEKKNEVSVPKEEQNVSALCNGGIPVPVPPTTAKARVWQLDLQCPLNSSNCGGNCQVVGGCCVAATDDDKYQLPSFYRDMVQYLTLVIICLAMAEAVIYGLMRSRANRMVAEELRRMETPLREKESAAELAAQLMDGIPTSVLAPQSPLSPDGTGGDDDTYCCSICLDDMRGKAVATLPCAHHLHRKCLQDFLRHQLVKSNNVTCPMCRTPILENHNGAPRLAVDLLTL